MAIEFIFRDPADTYLCFYASPVHAKNLNGMNAFQFGEGIVAFTKYSISSNYFLGRLETESVPQIIQPSWIYESLLCPWLMEQKTDPKLTLDPFFVVTQDMTYQITEHAQIVCGTQIISYGEIEELIFSEYHRYQKHPAKDVVTAMIRNIRRHSQNSSGERLIYSLKHSHFVELEAIQ